MAIGRPANCHDLAPFAALTIIFSCYECAINPDKSILPRIYKSSAKTFRIWINTLDLTRAWKYRWQVGLDGYRLGISAASARKMPFITSQVWPTSAISTAWWDGDKRLNGAHPSGLSMVTSLKGDHVLPFLGRVLVTSPCQLIMFYRWPCRSGRGCKRTSPPQPTPPARACGGFIAGRSGK